MRRLDPVRHEGKRREILEAAGRCFVRHGFKGASIAAICTEAGISPGHLYHYFASKEAIIGAMADLRLTEMAQRFHDVAADKEAIPALLAELRRKKSRIRQATPMVLELLIESGRNPAIAKIMRESSRRMRDLLAELLRKGQASRQIDPAIEPETAATILMGVLDGLKIVALREPKFDTEKGLAMLETMITRFLIPPAHGAQRDPGIADKRPDRALQ